MIDTDSFLLGLCAALPCRCGIICGYNATVTDLVAILPQLKRYALSLTRNGTQADDLVQETAVRVLGSIHSFKPGTNFKGWATRIMYNEFITSIRKSKSRSTSNIDDVAPAALSVKPDNFMFETMPEFTKRVRRLPLDQRLAMLMHVIEGMTYEEIAQTTGVEVGTIKSRVSRGRKALEGIL